MKFFKASIASFLFLACLFISHNASAGEINSAACEVCSEQQMQDLAKKHPKAFEGVYIFSLKSGELRRYRLEFVNWHETKLKEKATEPVVEDYFLALLQAYRGNNNSLIFKVKVSAANQSGSNNPPNMPYSAYEMLNDSSKMNVLMNFSYGKFTTYLAMVYDASKILNPSAWFKPSEAAFTMEISFPDSTKVTVQWDSASKQWKYVPGSARDGHNNSIPETKADFARGGYREYNFIGAPASDLNSFLNQAARNGIPVANGGAPRHGLACSSANGITTCQAF